MSGVVALAGGVGGAKLAQGLYRVLPPDSLTVLVNTADDFTLHGLRICPDLDTVLYTLAGLANQQTGWGITDDTFSTLDMLKRYGGRRHMVSTGRPRFRHPHPTHSGLGGRAQPQRGRKPL